MGLQKQLTVQFKFDDKPLHLYAEKGAHIGVPRGLCELVGIDHRVQGTPSVINCTVPPKNDEQVSVLAKAAARLKAGRSFVLQATTGFGKTYCAANLLSVVNTTTLIVVTKEDMMLQWRKELLKFTDLTEDEIGTAQQDQCDYKGKKVVLGMIHSLAKNKYGTAFNNYFGFVIYDEVHRLGAETFSKTAGMFPAKLRLGLSATVDRVDGKQDIFTAHIGPVGVQTAVVQLPPKILMRETGYKPSRKIKIEPARMMALYKDMGQNYARNAIIVEFLLASYKKGRNTIVFSDLIGDHLDILHPMARHAGIPAHDMAYYIGGMSEKARADAKTKRVLFATYAMTAEATDIPRLDTAVFATPRANITQPLGRILREFPGKPQPVVLDLVDGFSPMLMGFMSKRRTQYFSLKATLLSI